MMTHQHGADCKHSHFQETVLFILIVAVAATAMWLTTERENNDARARQHCLIHNGRIEELGVDAAHPLELPKWRCITE
jgi:hypothetical protein